MQKERRFIEVGIECDEQKVSMIINVAKGNKSQTEVTFQACHL